MYSILKNIANVVPWGCYPNNALHSAFEPQVCHGSAKGSGSLEGSAQVGIWHISSQPFLAEVEKMRNNGFGQIMAWLRCLEPSRSIWIEFMYCIINAYIDNI